MHLLDFGIIFIVLPTKDIFVKDQKVSWNLLYGAYVDRPPSLSNIKMSGVGWDSNVITGFLQALPAQVKNTAYQGDQLLFAALRELKALPACLADIMVLIYQST